MLRYTWRSKIYKGGHNAVRWWIIPARCIVWFRTSYDIPAGGFDKRYWDSPGNVFSVLPFPVRGLLMAIFTDCPSRFNAAMALIVVEDEKRSYKFLLPVIVSGDSLGFDADAADNCDKQLSHFCVLLMYSRACLQILQRPKTNVLFMI